MRKIVMLTLLALVVLPSIAQESEEKNVLKINTLSLIVGTGSIFYEREFSDNLSGQMGAAYLNYKIGDTEFSGLILTPEVRFYPRNNAIDGFYVAPYIRYQNFSLEDGEYKATYSNFGGGISLGRQWVTDSGFTMDLFFGAHYTSGKIDVDSGTEDDFDVSNFDGFRTRVGFSIGFAF
ncbi:MAG: DUF3575 domain-containing protein [Bacteroidales bacterium]